MKSLKRALAALGIVAVIAIMVTLVTPKTAKALVATLVQVVNTTANPAHTQDVSTTAAQIVELRCPQLAGCTQVFPDASTGPTGGYFVPVNQSLVITSVDILPPVPSTFPVFAVLAEAQPLGTYNDREKWLIQTNTTNLFQFPGAGIVVGPQSAFLVIFSFSNNSTLGLDSYTATLHGYLTSN